MISQASLLFAQYDKMFAQCINGKRTGEEEQMEAVSYVEI